MRVKTEILTLSWKLFNMDTKPVALALTTGLSSPSNMFTALALPSLTRTTSTKGR